VKGVHPSSISSLATFALLLDLAGISTEFSGAITTRFCFTYAQEGVTALPRGLHAKLCHAFLVNNTMHSLTLHRQLTFSRGLFAVSQTDIGIISPVIQLCVYINRLALQHCFRHYSQ